MYSEQYWKRSALTTAVNGGYAEHLNTMTLYCNNSG